MLSGRYFKACHGCTRPWKKPGCHSSCKDYREEREAYELAKEKERQKRELEKSLREAEYRRTDKSTKYYKRRK